MRCAQFVEQPRVLDGDDGLVGEVRHQRDLLVGEGTDFLARQGERTDQLVLLQHRDSQNCPDTSEFNGGDDGGCALFDVGRLCRDIGDMNRRFGRDHTADMDLPDLGRSGERLRNSAKAGGVLSEATTCKASPSQR